MMALGSACQTNGLGSRLCAATKPLMACCRATTEGNTPRLSWRWASLANRVSTAFSQEHEVAPTSRTHPIFQATELAPDMLGERKPIDAALTPAEDLVIAWSRQVPPAPFFRSYCTLISLPSAGYAPCILRYSE